VHQKYVPPPLPLQSAIQLDRLSLLLEKAAVALSELKNRPQSIRNTSLFTYMYVRKDVLLSRQIKGTHSSF
jgi:hypothetical protein